MFVFQIVLGLIIVFFEWRRTRAALVDLMTICSLVYFICFVVAPICGYYMLENWTQYSVMRYTYRGIQYENDSFYYTGILTVVGYLFFLFSFSITKQSKSTSLFHNVFGANVTVKRMLGFATTLLFLSLLALAFESYKVGGPLQWMISNPRLYNAVDAESVESTSWLADKFIRLSIIASYLFWGINHIVNKSQEPNSLKKSKGIIRVLFYLSLLLSVAVVIHAGGRFLLFQYFTTFLVASLIFKSKKLKLLPVLSLAFFGTVVLLYGRTFFKLFIYEDALSFIDNEDKSTIDIVFDVINNYTFPYYSFNNNLTFSPATQTFFADFFLWPLNFFPEYLRPDIMVDTTAINTYRLMGEYKRFIPSDIFSYGFINLGYFGILISTGFYGFVVKKLNGVIFRQNPISIILYVAVSFLIGFRIMYFDPYHFFKGSFEVLVCLTLIAIFNYGQKRK